MQCPRDGTILQPVHVAGIQLDKCHTCDGIWFDPGELKRIRNAKLANLETHIESKFGNPETERQATSGYMRCPRCRDARLHGVAYSIQPDQIVKLDRCEECFGFWVDNGELDAVTKSFKAQDTADSDSRLASFTRWLSRFWKE